MFLLYVFSSLATLHPKSDQFRFPWIRSPAGIRIHIYTGIGYLQMAAAFLAGRSGGHPGLYITKEGTGLYANCYGQDQL